MKKETFSTLEFNKIINLLEEIDYPGEWFLDHETQILYYYPPEDFENADIRLAARFPFFALLSSMIINIIVSVISIPIIFYSLNGIFGKTKTIPVSG